MTNDFERCVVPECAQRAVVHFTRASGRQSIRHIHYCESDVEGFFDVYYGSPRIGEGSPQVWKDGVGFDIELVMYDERTDKSCQMWLREIGGSRRLDCQIGPFEASALQRELDGFSAPRPLTHHVLASTIATLGGTLERVLIDKYFPTQAVSYEAKLHIEEMNATHMVDVRPSDAIILAVICRVPIVVSQSVLSALQNEARWTS